MKRLHVHLAVTDLEASVRFYASMFDAEPTVLEEDYAKWMLDDPRVNFAISTRGSRKGIDHLGIQAENESDFGEVHTRLETTGVPIVEQRDATCCYARSKKNWILDPEGIAWETFLTTGESAVYGTDEVELTGLSRFDRSSTEDAQSRASCCDGPEDSRPD